MNINSMLLVLKEILKYYYIIIKLCKNSFFYYLFLRFTTFYTLLQKLNNLE